MERARFTTERSTKLGNVNRSQEEKNRYFEKIKSVQKNGMDNNDVMEHYKTWAESYDEDNFGVEVAGIHWAAEALNNAGVPKTSKILDCAAGTGLVTELLRGNFGFTGPIDALDASKEMLEKAKIKDIYNELICSFIGDGNVIPINDNTYDHAVMGGGLAEGHIKLDAFLELIRVVKPGGLVVNVMREENRRKVEAYMNFDEYLHGLEKQGLWEKVSEEIRDKYYMDYQGLVNVWRVTKPL